MKTFYTIIKIASNTLAGDTLSIGLLLHNGEKFWLQFSEERIDVAEKLLESKAGFVDFVVTQIEHKVEEMNRSLKAADYTLFGANNILNDEKFLHISNYSNGVLRFLEPILLNDNINDEKFQQLFSLLIDKNQQKIKLSLDDSKDKEFKEKIKKNLIEKVQNKVHTNLQFKPDDLAGLYCKFDIECIGLNGAFIAAKGIPFHKKYEAIDKEVSHYMTLISILKLKFKKESAENHFYIIADEPINADSREHRTWESLRKNPAIEIRPTDEAALIAVEIEEKKATTFL